MLRERIEEIVNQVIDARLENLNARIDLIRDDLNTLTELLLDGDTPTTTQPNKRRKRTNDQLENELPRVTVLGTVKAVGVQTPGTPWKLRVLYNQKNYELTVPRGFGHHKVEPGDQVKCSALIEGHRFLRVKDFEIIHN